MIYLDIFFNLKLKLWFFLGICKIRSSQDMTYKFEYNQSKFNKINLI
jgi:hypothetical protein